MLAFGLVDCLTSNSRSGHDSMVAVAAADEIAAVVVVVAAATETECK